MSTMDLPTIIQGGMGVGVSSWRLARSVSRSGQLGVVSGTALDVVLARRLQDGDPGGHMRRALAHFPVPEIAAGILERYYEPEGRAADQPYRPVPKLTLRQSVEGQQLAVVANFVEVWLAKEGHDGQVGINFLEKIQMATPAAALGAVLAGVDVVLMGAGVPREIPRLLDDLAKGEVGRVSVDVAGAEEPYAVEVDPRGLLGDDLLPLPRPRFLAIVSATVLASYLARDESTRPDGFVVEAVPAGGHNAPPRGKMVLDEGGEPVYGPKDEVDLAKVAALGLPFWLAGARGTPEAVAEALEAGAVGVQVGTLFALADESGLRPDLRDKLRAELVEETLEVRTDARISPTGFPFKVAQVDETIAEKKVYDDRVRLCDLSYLRTPFVTPKGNIGYRCPGEPQHMWLRKGGQASETEGRGCLCNGLTAAIGLGQTRRDGYIEPSLLTMGSDLAGARTLAELHPDGWSADEAVEWLTSRVGPRALHVTSSQ